MWICGLYVDSALVGWLIELLLTSAAYRSGVIKVLVILVLILSWLNRY